MFARLRDAKSSAYVVVDPDDVSSITQNDRAPTTCPTTIVVMKEGSRYEVVDIISEVVDLLDKALRERGTLNGSS